MLPFQRNAQRRGQVEGTGLQHRNPVHLRLTPARRGQESSPPHRPEGFPDRSNASSCGQSQLRTTLMKKGVMISTVEHLLSALLRGSVSTTCTLDSIPWKSDHGRQRQTVHREIDRVGVQEQEALRQYMLSRSRSRCATATSSGRLPQPCRCGHLHHRLRTSAIGYRKSRWRYPPMPIVGR